MALRHLAPRRPLRRRVTWLVLLALALGAPIGAAHGETAIAVRRLAFDSGLSVILARTPPTPQLRGRVNVEAYVRFGSMDEPGLGQAHLIEHVIANNGSTLQAAPHFPPQFKSYDSNAATKAHYTSYMQVLPPEGLEAAIYARMATFGRKRDDPAVFAREKGRVVDELERDRGSPRYAAYKSLEAVARGKSARLDDEIAAVRAARQADVRVLADQSYSPSRGVLVVAGDIDLDRTAAIVKSAVHALGMDVRSPARPAPPRLRLATGRQVTVDQNKPGDFAAAVGFQQPRHDGPDLLPFLVLDQLLLGGRTDKNDPRDIARSDAAPLPSRLSRFLGGATQFWDGKESQWGGPAFAEGDPTIYAILFATPAALPPARVLEATRAALRDVRAHAMSDADIETAKRDLASFYERWLLEPNLRILADHLAAVAFAGGDPARVQNLPSEISSVRPGDVRRVMDRYLIGAAPLVVVTTPLRGPAPNPP
jgi:predicted Zn-dependent peptidase